MSRPFPGPDLTWLRRQPSWSRTGPGPTCSSGVQFVPRDPFPVAGISAKVALDRARTSCGRNRKYGWPRPSRHRALGCSRLRRGEAPSQIAVDLRQRRQQFGIDRVDVDRQRLLPGTLRALDLAHQFPPCASPTGPRGQTVEDCSAVPAVCRRSRSGPPPSANRQPSRANVPDAMPYPESVSVPKKRRATASPTRS